MEITKPPPERTKKARPRSSKAGTRQNKFCGQQQEPQAKASKDNQNKSIFQKLHKAQAKLLCTSKNINLILNTPKRDLDTLKEFVRQFNEYLTEVSF